ncbi:hypothetical protein H4582DRAFT_2156915 [Lactarius indigo]|nr:hypothetical protein H4582DRAFT_2156915 [Lactarius indigo]
MDDLGLPLRPVCYVCSILQSWIPRALTQILAYCISTEPERILFPPDPTCARAIVRCRTRQGLSAVASVVYEAHSNVTDNNHRLLVGLEMGSRPFSCSTPWTTGWRTAALHRAFEIPVRGNEDHTRRIYNRRVVPRGGRKWSTLRGLVQGHRTPIDRSARSRRGTMRWSFFRALDESRYHVFLLACPHGQGGLLGGRDGHKGETDWTLLGDVTGQAAHGRNVSKMRQ